jgi:hypothetical protein
MRFMSCFGSRKSDYPLPCIHHCDEEENPKIQNIDCAKPSHRAFVSTLKTGSTGNRQPPDRGSSQLDFPMR